jgi:hypothetical protein
MASKRMVERPIAAPDLTSSNRCVPEAGLGDRAQSYFIGTGGAPDELRQR